jgi:hypothetical protein
MAVVTQSRALLARPQVVLADPASGCQSFANERALSNSIVVVERGLCRFTDKAINVQTADGAALVVVNDESTAIRMPLSDDERSTVHVPSVMVSQVSLYRDSLPLS